MFGIKDKIFAGFALVMITAMGLMYWQLTIKDQKISDQSEKIGTQAQLIAQQAQKIIDTEQDKANIKLAHKAAEDALIKTRIAKEKLERDDKLHRIQIDRLKHENKTINDYLNTPAPLDVVWLLRHQPTENSDINSDSVSSTTETIDDGNTSAVYTTESLVFYSLALETALDQCNLDKKGIRDWAAEVEQLNDNQG